MESKHSKSETPKGLAMLKGTRIVGAKSTVNDPELTEGLLDDQINLKSLDDELDVDETMREAMEALEGEVQGKVHPIGNGTTLPYPDSGEPTTDFAQCSKHVPGQNRGCRFYGTSCRLPMLAVKHKQPGGPYNLRFKDLRTGVVKIMSCTDMAQAYLRMPNIVLLPPSEDDPPGETWVPTKGAEYTPLPNGQMPTPGPNQPRTPIKLTPRRTRVVCSPSREMMREYQLMRRRGDFDRKPARGARKR